MDRRIVIVVLVFCLVVVALTFAALAAGRAGSPDGVASPDMSGDFAQTHFAAAGAHSAPSIYVPSDRWRMKGPGAGRASGVGRRHLVV
jgi:hypothetical protein